MLILTRRVGESIVVGDDVTVTVFEVRGDAVRLGIDAPRSIKVHRQEVYDELQRANREAVSPSDDAIHALRGALGAAKPATSPAAARPAAAKPAAAKPGAASAAAKPAAGSALDGPAKPADGSVPGTPATDNPAPERASADPATDTPAEPDPATVEGAPRGQQTPRPSAPKPGDHVKLHRDNDAGAS